jgi:cytochrome b pre-mRNA-processing protein 3
VAGFFSRRSKHERAAYHLYGSAVAAARDPYLYAALGVPDTLDGRFDAICLHVYLLIRRLNQDGAAGAEMAQAVFDAMFHDMDINLREMGVGDLSVGKRNRKMWEAFHGRSAAYAAAWEDSDAFASSLGLNVWRGAEPPGGSPALLVRLARAQFAALLAQPATTIMAGTVQFLPAQEATR